MTYESNIILSFHSLYNQYLSRHIKYYPAILLLLYLYVTFALAYVGFQELGKILLDWVVGCGGDLMVYGRAFPDHLEMQLG